MATSRHEDPSPLGSFTYGQRLQKYGGTVQNSQIHQEYRGPMRNSTYCRRESPTHGSTALMFAHLSRVSRARRELHL
eukprot:8306096-Pyramimonas_sp.AAC.1